MLVVIYGDTARPDFAEESRIGIETLECLRFFIKILPLDVEELSALDELDITGVNDIDSPLLIREEDDYIDLGSLGARAKVLELVLDLDVFLRSGDLGKPCVITFGVILKHFLRVINALEHADAGVRHVLDQVAVDLRARLAYYGFIQVIVNGSRLLIEEQPADDEHGRQIKERVYDQDVNNDSRYAPFFLFIGFSGLVHQHPLSCSGQQSNLYFIIFSLLWHGIIAVNICIGVAERHQLDMDLLTRSPEFVSFPDDSRAARLDAFDLRIGQPSLRRKQRRG